MKYKKPALSYEDQANQLLSRGLIATKNDIVGFLKRVNYYRLTFYLFPYRISNSESYKKGTTLNQIIRIYEFDNKLRNLTLLNLSEIEISILHSIFVEYFTIKYGPFGYLDENNFHPAHNRNDYVKCISNIKNSIKISKEEFVQHFRKKYTPATKLPMWMAVETCSFGTLSKLFSMMKTVDQVQITRNYKVSYEEFQSWLHSLSYTRNLCAHHARFFNRTLGVQPKNPRKMKLPVYFDPFTPRNDRIFSVLSIMKYLLDSLYLGDKFKDDLIKLLCDYPEIDMSFSGFEPNWQEHKLWQ